MRGLLNAIINTFSEVLDCPERDRNLLTRISRPGLEQILQGRLQSALTLATQLKEHDPAASEAYMDAIHEMGKSEGFQVPGYDEVQSGQGQDQSGHQGISDPDEGQGGAKAMKNQLEDVRVKAMRKRMAALEDAIQGTVERIQWAESQPSLGEEQDAKQRHEQLEVMVNELQQSMAEAEALEVNTQSLPRSTSHGLTAEAEAL